MGHGSLKDGEIWVGERHGNLGARLEFLSLAGNTSADEGLAGPGADDDLNGKLLLSPPIGFLAQGPKQSLFLIQRLKEQMNSSKLWRKES